MDPDPEELRAQFVHLARQIEDEDVPGGEQNEEPRWFERKIEALRKLHVETIRAQRANGDRVFAEVGRDVWYFTEALMLRLVDLLSRKLETEPAEALLPRIQKARRLMTGPGVPDYMAAKGATLSAEAELKLFGRGEAPPPAPFFGTQNDLAEWIDKTYERYGGQRHENKVRGVSYSRFAKAMTFAFYQTLDPERTTGVSDKRDVMIGKMVDPELATKRLPFSAKTIIAKRSERRRRREQSDEAEGEEGVARGF